MKSRRSNTALTLLTSFCISLSENIQQFLSPASILESVAAFIVSVIPTKTIRRIKNTTR